MAFTIMTISGCVSFLLIVLSLGYLRNFCIKYIIRFSSRTILRLAGYKPIYPSEKQFPKHQVLYTFNHNSFLDIFLLTGLGLSNTRVILSTSTLKYLPLVISAKAIGTFYLPMQEDHEKRVKVFKKITNHLKSSNNSIFGSSEGVHNQFNGIEKFNKGVYHMALEANIPIVALYIHIPDENNFRRGKYDVPGGSINLEILGEIETRDWKLESLEEHIQGVRSLFVNRFNELNPNHPTN